MKKINFLKYTSSLWVMAHACVYGMGDENNALMLSSRNSQSSAAAVEVEQGADKKISFLNLPDLPLSIIISYLEPKEIEEVAGVCEDLKNLVANYEAYLFFEVKRILNQKLSQENGYFKYYRGMPHFNQNKWIEYFNYAFNDYIADQTKPVLFDSSFIWFHKLPSNSYHDRECMLRLWDNPLAASHYKATHKLYGKLGQNADEILPSQSELYKSASEINDDTPVVSYVTLTSQEWTVNTNELRDRLKDYFRKRTQTTLVLDIETGEGLKQIINSLQVKNIALSNTNNVTTIENDFLLGCWNLQSIDLSGLSNVTTIGNNFLSSCRGLKSIDLSGLKNVTTIGNNFLSLCRGLQSIDLSGLRNVTTIGNNFLMDCGHLQPIDLTPLSNVTTIGNGFLSLCTYSQSIDLSGLINVTTIGDNFLSYCCYLQSIDLSGLSNVTTIGNHFLRHCSGLKSIDLSGLSNVTTIGNHFLRHCSGLKSIDLSGLSNVTTIEHNFLSYCSSLKSIDLSVLSNVTTIGDYFLSCCSGLQSIDLSGLRNVTTIGDWFLSRCRGLKSIDLSGLSKVTTIGGRFLSELSSLTDATLDRSMENGIVHRKLIDVHPRVTITWIG